MLKEQFQHDEAYAPARVLNLVVVVDREWRGEILNRLEQVGRYGASRTIVCAVEEGVRLSTRGPRSRRRPSTTSQVSWR